MGYMHSRTKWASRHGTGGATCRSLVETVSLSLGLTIWAMASQPFGIEASSLMMSNQFSGTGPKNTSRPVKDRLFRLNCTKSCLSSVCDFEATTCGQPVRRPSNAFLWLIRVVVWCSMFSVDGSDISNGLPLDAGPNQELAERMGVVMGTSHHEPMAKNQKEFTDFGTGEWNYMSNKEFLDDFWRHGADRAKGKETVFTVGMRGDGDLPLDGANVEVNYIDAFRIPSGPIRLTLSSCSSVLCRRNRTYYSQHTRIRSWTRYRRCGQCIKRSCHTTPME